MAELWPVLAAVGVIGAVIVLRLFLGSIDRARIREYVREQGGHVESIEWNPLGRGWFGSENQRIYTVYYVDPEDRSHKATCKTSLFGGVYWTEDRVVGEPVWETR